MTFDTALTFVLAWEGGESDDFRDPGGHTKYGISSRGHPDADTRTLTLERAATIYRQAYWDRLGLGGLPPTLAVTVFDAAVNAGPKRSVIWLQQALGVTADGILGPQTRATANNHPEPELIRAKMLFRRLEHYATLAAKPTLRPFLRGWLNRVLALNHLEVS